MAVNTSRILCNIKNLKFLINKSCDVRCSISDKRYFSVARRTNMRYVQFRANTGGVQHLGAQITSDGDIFDLSAVDSSIPNSLVKFLATGKDVRDKAKRYVV